MQVLLNKVVKYPATEIDEVDKRRHHVQASFLELQCHIANNLVDFDGNLFQEDNWKYDSGGGGKSMVLEGGSAFEKAGVNFSAIQGKALPIAATEKRPFLRNCPFYATGVSVVIHPHNPFVPTSHANVRFFIAKTVDGPVWWFGGGFDLTPYYGFEEDCVYWHQQAKSVCDKYDNSYYPRFKEVCDNYFYIKHRQEHRGIGGIFFDDFNELDFITSLSMAMDVGRTFIASYMALVKRRNDISYSAVNKDFQEYRRGRYVEFNLVYDRGTLFGLQSSGRTESILMSLPPIVQWKYDHKFDQDSEEYKLTDYYLKPKNWV